MNSLRRPASAATGALLLVIALAACTAGTEGPTHTSSTAQPSTVDPATPHAFTVDEVQSTLAELPVRGAFEWLGGAGTSSPAQNQFTWSDYDVEPLQCQPFFHLYGPSFEDDRELAPNDVIVSKSLQDRAGVGGDDDRFLANINVRLLDDARRAMRDGIDRLDAAAPSCKGGFVVTHRALDTESQHAVSVEPLDVPSAAADADGAVMYIADSSGAFSVPQSVWAWLAMDNVLIAIDCPVDPDVPESSVEGCQEIVADVAEGFTTTVG